MFIPFLRHSFDNKKEKWKLGIDYEINFWDNWLKTRGDRWPEDYIKRLKSKQKISNYLIPYIRKIKNTQSIKIMDVGAGPLTNIGNYLEGYTLEITATDPLANQYNQLLDKYKIIPPIRTQFAEVENLSSLYSQNTFDLVHMRNALDHSCDPIKGIREMLALVKKNHFIVLFHSVNEAENGNYVGFHQWNFDSNNNRDFIIWNKTQAKNVTKILNKIAKIKTDKIQNSIKVEIKKI